MYKKGNSNKKNVPLEQLINKMTGTKRCTLYDNSLGLTNNQSSKSTQNDQDKKVDVCTSSKNIISAEFEYPKVNHVSQSQPISKDKEKVIGNNNKRTIIDDDDDDHNPIPSGIIRNDPESVKIELASALDEINVLRNENNSYTATINSYEEEQKKLKGKIVTCEAKIAELESAMGKYKNEIAKQQSIGESGIKLIQDKCNSLTLQKEKAEAEKRLLEEKLKMGDNYIGSLSVFQNLIIERINGAESKIIDSIEANSNSGAQSKDQAKHIQTLIDEIKKLKIENDKLKKDVEESIKDKKNADEYAKLKAEYEKCKLDYGILKANTKMDCKLISDAKGVFEKARADYEQQKAIDAAIIKKLEEKLKVAESTKGDNNKELVDARKEIDRLNALSVKDREAIITLDNRAAKNGEFASWFEEIIIHLAEHSALCMRDDFYERMKLSPCYEKGGSISKLLDAVLKMPKPSDESSDDMAVLASDSSQVKEIKLLPVSVNKTNDIKVTNNVESNRNSISNEITELKSVIAINQDSVISKDIHDASPVEDIIINPTPIKKIDNKNTNEQSLPIEYPITQDWCDWVEMDVLMKDILGSGIELDNGGTTINEQITSVKHKRLLDIQSFSSPQGPLLVGYDVQMVKGPKALLSLFNALPSYTWDKEFVGDKLFYKGALNIAVSQSDSEQMGWFGAGRQHKALCIERVGAAARLKTKKGIKISIPPSQLANNDKDIMLAYDAIVNKQKWNNKVCLSLVSTLLNNAWRTNKNVNPEFIEEYMKGEPVFGDILLSLEDGEVINTDGHRFIMSDPIGGFTTPGTNILGPYKGINPFHQQKVIWDLNHVPITYIEAEKGRTLLKAHFKTDLIFYHFYQNRQTLHWHYFKNIEDFYYSCLCDIWTDRNQPIITKGFIIDAFYPVTDKTVDHFILALMFCGLGIRIGGEYYKNGLEGTAPLQLPSSVVRDPLFQFLKNEWITKKIIYIGTGLDNGHENCVIPSEIKFVEVSLSPCTPARSFSIIQSNSKSLKKAVIPEYNVFPSKRALESEPQSASISSFKTHDLIYCNGKGTITPDQFVNEYYEIPNFLSYKKGLFRGTSKMEEMLDILDLIDGDVLLLGDGSGGYVRALNKVNNGKKLIIDLKIDSSIPKGVKTVEADVNTMNINVVKDYDIVISDLCSKKGADSEFSSLFRSLIIAARDGTKFLLKLKGLYEEGGGYSPYGLLANYVASTYTDFALLKPSSSRLRNSEVFLYFEKKLTNEPLSDVCEKYSILLSFAYKDIDLRDVDLYDRMGIVTPLKKMHYLEFLSRVYNGANVEFFTDDRDIVLYIGYCFSRCTVTYNGEKYCVQGYKYNIAKYYAAMGGYKSSLVVPPLVKGQSYCPRSEYRDLKIKDNIIANIAKHMIVLNNSEENIIDLGAGNSGLSFLRKERIHYPAAFHSYIPYDPMYTEEFLPYSRKGLDVLGEIVESPQLDSTILMLQSAHYILNKVKPLTVFGKLVDKCKKIIYTTWLPSDTTIRDKSGAIWYQNDGSNVTWAGQTDPIIPAIGQIIHLEPHIARLFNRTLSEEHMTVLQDLVICVVSKKDMTQHTTTVNTNKAQYRTLNYTSTNKYVPPKSVSVPLLQLIKRKKHK